LWASLLFPKKMTKRLLIINRLVKMIKRSVRTKKRLRMFKTIQRKIWRKYGEEVYLKITTIVFC
jgi:hypothetical protein